MSRRTYLFSEVLKPFVSLESVGLECDFTFSTLLGDCDKHFKEIVLKTVVEVHCPLSLSVLVNKIIHLSVRIKELDSLLDEFQRI